MTMFCSACVCSCVFDVVDLGVKINRMQQEHIARNLARGVEFEKFFYGHLTVIPFDVTVATDSAEFTFREDLSAIVEVEGIRYLHGSVGHDMEYHAIPFSEIRYLIADWPIKVIRTDSTVVRAESGRWRMLYQQGMISAAKLSADSIIWIPAKYIARIESGYEP